MNFFINITTLSLRVYSEDLLRSVYAVFAMTVFYYFYFAFNGNIKEQFMLIQGSRQIINWKNIDFQTFLTLFFITQAIIDALINSILFSRIVAVIFFIFIQSLPLLKILSLANGDICIVNNFFSIIYYFDSGHWMLIFWKIERIVTR